mmetsp:Transcript_21718/g.25024  ORF Transcript_21718/g.25024 Transcript_21718/m.25024 type:complete len:84 (+) Transcript_21718:187-438(+)
MTIIFARIVLDEKDQMIDELQTENTRLREALATKDKALVTTEEECHRLRAILKVVLKNEATEPSAVADVMEEEGIYNGILKIL